MVTEIAFDLLNELKLSFPNYEHKREIANESEATDYYLDLEFVDVAGGFGSGDLDNPHEEEKWIIDDKPHKNARVLEEDYYFTSFNHYIDIKKGPGLFDDYDGYSFRHGSASKDQHQAVGEATSNSWAQFITKITNKFGLSIKVDEAINWWFNDEYVHAPGQTWYNHCSPSIERYSFFGDKGLYKSIEEEAKERFPLAKSVGAKGNGVPYSVFMPVDNMARFYFNKYLAESVPKYLGPVMHAIQDASIPHHAAGLCGNWHSRYETELDSRIPIWRRDAQFQTETKSLFLQWFTNDAHYPTSLNNNDWSKIPKINWKIDMLVTWLALNAYKEYILVFENFKNGYVTNDLVLKELTKKATAMSMLVLCKAVSHFSNS